MKVLEFFGEPLSYGGQESFMINMYQHFDHNNEYCFVTPFYSNNDYFVDLIHQNNDKCISEGYNFESKLRKKYIIQTAKKVMSDEYDVIHIHSGSIFTLLLVARIAKKRGIKKIIVHSHATGNDNITHTVIKTVSDRFLDKYAIYFLACSMEAGKFKYSDRVLSGKRFFIIRNGIDIQKYTYCEDIRRKKRQELGLEDKHVICHVGRYSPEKNHSFLLDLINEYVKVDPSGVLLLVGGKGPAENEIQEKIESLKIEKQVKMLFERKDVNELLSAADIFVFPSLFEGLGISAIEAQAAGLVTICSEFVPDDVAVSPLYHKMSVQDGVKPWAVFIKNHISQQRVDVSNEIEKNGYSAEHCAHQLEDIYFLNED